MDPKELVFSWQTRESHLYTVQENLRFCLKEIIQRKHALNEGKFRVLDLGCLSGEAIVDIANIFPSVEAHGLSLRSNSKWKNHKTVFWHVGHAQKMPLKNNYFDFVYSHFGITHANLEQSLKELHRILRNNGEAAFNLEPSKTSSPYEVDRIAKAIGFEITKHEFARTGRSLEAKHIIHLRKIG
jgi:ubiquinone/menaquinone biosynthesis C-methylase UbiE